MKNSITQKVQKGSDQTNSAETPLDPTAELLKTLAAMQKQIDSLKKWESDTNTNTNRQEKYKWPLWSFRYKIYNGKAIVKAETVAMNTVKNHVTNKYISLHEMLLTFADGSTEKVDYDLYVQLLQWSPGYELHELNDVRMDTLTFNNKWEEISIPNHKFWSFVGTPHGDFEVPELFIN